MRARRILCLALLGALGGCGTAPFEYHSQREIPRGAGMFSGEEGAFILHAKETRGAAGSESQDYRDFRRRSEAGGETPEQREFREWRERRDWRDWREWKERQRN